jgi:acyl-CoA synthetase (NDP forming)
MAATDPRTALSFEDIRVEAARTVCTAAASEGNDRWLTQSEIRDVLGAFGLPLAAGAIARTADEAAALASSTRASKCEGATPSPERRGRTWTKAYS